MRLNETLQAKRMEFEEGVADFGYTPISLQKADVVPGSWLLGHFEGKDTIKVNMGNPESSKQLMMHVGSPSLRQKIFSAAYAVEPRHTHTFDELMKNRLDLAKLVGYPSWGHKVLEHGMVQEPEMVADFLKHLRVRLQPHLKEEVATMKAMQMQMDDAMATQLENTTTKTTTATEKDLLPSDRHFLVGLAQESTRPPDLPEYFSVGNCMEGLGMITEHIYGVSVWDGTCDLHFFKERTETNRERERERESQSLSLSCARAQCAEVKRKITLGLNYLSNSEFFLRRCLSFDPHVPLTLVYMCAQFR